MPHRLFPQPWMALFLETPLALVSMLALLATPEILQPLAAAFAGAVGVWWFLDGRPWHRRIGYALVSAMLGLPMGLLADALAGVFWGAWPAEGRPGMVIGAVLISVYVAKALRGVAKAWTDDPEELAELLKGVIHRWAGRGVRRPPAPPAEPPRGEDRS